MNPYDELGVGPTATADEIRAAHRKAAKRDHPDRGGDAERFDRIQRAFAILRDPEKRRVFDETGRIDEQPASSLEQRSLAAASAAVMSMVTGAQDLAGIDVIAGALHYIKGQLDGLEIKRQQIERNIDRLTVARGRLRNLSDQPDVLGDMFAWQEADLRATLPRIEDETRVQRGAEAILKRYGYTFEIEGRQVSISRDGSALNVTLS